MCPDGKVLLADHCESDSGINIRTKTHQLKATHSVCNTCFEVNLNTPRHIFRSLGRLDFGEVRSNLTDSRSVSRLSVQAVKNYPFNFLRIAALVHLEEGSRRVLDFDQVYWWIRLTPD
jgi:hypothetical protein